jgi:hypothetical protein
MTRDEHIERILSVLTREAGVTASGHLLAALKNLLYVLLDRAIADGVREAKLSVTESRN